MPKIKSYTAAWLSKPSPGYALFAPPSEGTKSSSSFTPYASKKKPLPGPRRTIARRGTEVFVASGKELRWGDLAYLKENWTRRHSRTRSGIRIKREDSTESVDYADAVDAAGEADGQAKGLRTIKTPVADDIRQLVISPNSTYMAILTAYTVHICLLPDSSHLTAQDTGPIKAKIWTLGPTTHVTSRSPIVSAIWHPLGVNSSCLVTVTSDAIVRVWELSLNDRWSFDKPTLAIDLKKLADGTAVDQDFSVAQAATNRGFSADLFEMRVASAAFATRGSGQWCPMTLWLAMRDGDIYALCPLLPQRWAPPPTLIPSLSVSIVSKVAAIEDDPDVPERDKLLAMQQFDWMGDLDNQEPQIVDTAPGEPAAEVYTRPARPGAVPKLQGPFVLEGNHSSDDNTDNEVTDIMVIGQKVDTDDLMMGEEEDLDFDDGDHEGLSLSVVCLLSTSGQVKVFVDLDSVEAQWLPPKQKAKLTRSTPESPSPSLLAFQCIDTLTPIDVYDEAWPVFSPDVLSRYGFYVTTNAGITFMSLAPWVFRLESELQGDSTAGSDFRLNLLVSGQSSTRERLFSQPSGDIEVPLAAAVAIRDPDVGYFLLSATPYDPIALTFETPDDGFTALERDPTPYESETPDMQPLDFLDPRPVFQPSYVFDEETSLPTLLARLRTSRHKAIVGQEVRLSPVALSIFTDAHKILSDDTHRLGHAVSELFRRGDMLKGQFHQQVRKAAEIRAKIDRITGEADGEAGEGDDARLERRVAEAQDRQARLADRLEALRVVVGKATTRALSAKERAFADEVRSVEAAVMGPSAAGAGGGDEAGAGRHRGQPWRRYEDVVRLRDELAAEASRVQAQGKTTGEIPGEEGRSSPGPELRVPSDVKKAKLQQVRSLLSRENDLVEAVTLRLSRLQATNVG